MALTGVPAVLPVPLVPRPLGPRGVPIIPVLTSPALGSPWGICSLVVRIRGGCGCC